jgi:RNA polymerase sigma-70 factor (ECF subfamily)
MSYAFSPAFIQTIHYHASPVDSIETEIGGSNVAFQPTLWTVVLKARGAESREALDRLISLYWKPVYFFIRRRGVSVENAKDITQEFFVRFLEGPLLQKVDPGKGKFRTFVLAVLQNFLGKMNERDRAQKRGGGRAPLSLDVAGAERELQGFPKGQDTPETLFQRQWCRTVLESAFEKLEVEMTREGRERQFQALKAHLSSEPVSHQELAERLGLSEADVSNAIQRVRKRYQEMILQEVGAYVQNPADVKDEVRELFQWAR